MTPSPEHLPDPLLSIAHSFRFFSLHPGLTQLVRSASRIWRHLPSIKTPYALQQAKISHKISRFSLIHIVQISRPQLQFSRSFPKNHQASNCNILPDENYPATCTPPLATSLIPPPAPSPSSPSSSALTSRSSLSARSSYAISKHSANNPTTLA